MTDADLFPTKGTHVALCSGGMESTVATHISIRWGACDIILYLDTGVGAEPNKRFVERLSDELGVCLFTVRTNEDYGDLVDEYGFPGVSQHDKMYAALKERQLGRLATLTNGRGNATDDLYLWTGVRKAESENRMEHVERRQEAERWTWLAPIHDWSETDVRRYHQRFNLPTNYLWSVLGRSGDCWCGAYGNPEELIDAEAAGCTRLVDQLRDLEDRTGKPWPEPPSDVELRADDASSDDHQLMLCDSCQPAEAVDVDGGGR